MSVNRITGTLVRFGSGLRIEAEVYPEENGEPSWRDISGELAVNPGPYTSSWLRRDGGWWMRSLDQIDALTFHHTLSDSPHATAKHCIEKSGGLPTIQYSVWITQTGEVLLCVPLTEGLWHDSSGHKNTHLSVGLAGRLHEYRPAEVQLVAAAKFAIWALESGHLPGITDLKQITGHKNVVERLAEQGYYGDEKPPYTVCPGWDSQASGRWMYQLLDMIGL